MSSRTAPATEIRASRQQEPTDSYPNIPEPRQSHVGNAMAILSIFAILAFGAWTAAGTLLGSGDRPAAQLQAAPTAAPTKAPAAQAPTPTAAPTAQPAAPGGTPGATAGRPATPAAAGGRVHVVGAGDTLYRIAQLYGTTVDAIMAANGFSDRSRILRVGDKLTIP